MSGRICVTASVGSVNIKGGLARVYANEQKEYLTALTAEETCVLVFLMQR